MDDVGTALPQAALAAPSLQLWSFGVVVGSGLEGVSGPDERRLVEVPPD